MIKNLSINNFKSIKNLNLNSKRTNLFIREPNYKNRVSTYDKSNILKARGLLSMAV